MRERKRAARGARPSGSRRDPGRRGAPEAVDSGRLVSRVPGRPAREVFEARLAAARARQQTVPGPAPAGSLLAAAVGGYPGRVRSEQEGDSPRPALHRRRPAGGRHRARPPSTAARRLTVVALACAAVGLVAATLALAVT